MGSKSSLRTLIRGIPEWPCRISTTPELSAIRVTKAGLSPSQLLDSCLLLSASVCVHTWGCTSARAQRSEENLVELICKRSGIPLSPFPITAGLAAFYESSGMFYGLNCLFLHPLPCLYSQVSLGRRSHHFLLHPAACTMCAVPCQSRVLHLTPRVLTPAEVVRPKTVR